MSQGRKIKPPMKRPLAFGLLAFGLLALSSGLANALPIKTKILNPQKKMIGRANVYIDYVELLDPAAQPKGRVGFVKADGRFQLFVVRDGGKQEWVGRAANRRLYDTKGKLLALYDWTTFWVYVYTPEGEKLGQARCIAFRGICAAGVASYLTGLLEVQ